MTFDEDRELRARLRAADPAADLEPATPERMARLLEDTMDQNTHPSTRDEQATTRRSPLTWVAAAAAVAVLVGGGFWFTRGGDAPSPPVAASWPRDARSWPDCSPRRVGRSSRCW